jgi:hypothetical protein
MRTWLIAAVVIGISFAKLERDRQVAKIAPATCPLGAMTGPAEQNPHHPDRRARTLANVTARGATGMIAPGGGARDTRINLKILQWHALRAADTSAKVRERLHEFDPATRPDAWAGTVQDGFARGFAVALEEAIALGQQPVIEQPFDPVHTQHITGKDLRKKKDLLVASAGARIRFSRKEGVLFVDRKTETNSPNCLRFEDRRDQGTLDGFCACENERPRLFSAQFLKPVRYTIAKGHTELELAGSLGRGANGFTARMLIIGRETAATIELRLTIDNRHKDHRLRARFLGIAPTAILHECTDVSEVVHSDAGNFVAFTLVRAISTLLVDDNKVICEGAQCLGPVTHTFRLG